MEWNVFSYIMNLQDLYEEVDLITKGGNYGWRVYEGPYPVTPTESPGGNTSLKSINPIPPILGYTHSQINKNEGSASITGGYVYRSTTDPCMFGRYTSFFFSFMAFIQFSYYESPTLNKI